MKPRMAFLSHATSDRKAAGKVVDCLKRHKVRVWYSRHNLVPAQAWHNEIGRALRKCDWMVVLLSPAAVRSEWVQREVTYALIGKRYRKRIVPILLKDCQHHKLSWTLSGMQMVDMRRDVRAGLRALLAVWNIQIRDGKD